MRFKALRLLKWVGLALVVTVVAVLALRVWLAQQGAPLELWHTVVPHELSARDIARTDWAGFLAAEQQAFDEVRTEVTAKLAPEARVPANRYFDGSPIYPGRFAHDWNRSYLLSPVGKPVGAVVLLHGLTDAPYSLRHVARRYQARGYVAVGIRLPGHGTVPGGLSRVEWQAWSEATRLAVREARRRIGPDLPLHLVGYSNGGALALQYALDALEDKALARPDRLVLISPMVGVTNLAGFAGVLGWPAVFPAFEKAAWLGIEPEFNPFKYNSFPVNGARQSALVVRALQRQLARFAGAGRLGELPPILTFQSVVDATVSTRAIVDALYAQLPANGSELVLFDLNQSAKFGSLLRPGRDLAAAALLSDPPRRYGATLVTNVSPDSGKVEARTVAAGASREAIRALGLAYPAEVFSLSHVALPFPLDDALYGLAPSGTEDFGVRLGAMAVRGERGTLLVSLEALSRVTSNPFFAYMLERIDEQIGIGSRPVRTAPVSMTRGSGS
ncbi:MAG: alpha/beta hydrolase [Burkholderiales bacterium]